MTAVEYMINAMLGEHTNVWEAEIKKALEIEKQQIIDSYSHGWHDGQDVIIGQVSHVDLGGDAAGEVHYTEIYKKGGKP